MSRALSLERVHEVSERERRWNSGRATLSRTARLAGRWSRDAAGRVTHESKELPAAFARAESLDSVFRRWDAELAGTQRPRDLRLVLRREVRTISRGEKRLRWAKSSFYVETRRNGATFSRTFTASPASLAAAAAWLRDIEQYAGLPECRGAVDAKLIVFSPGAFGYLLHEALGHRLESDDHAATIRWPKFRKTNFSVYDVPGREDWLGFTPFDDLGTRGRAVKLFDGNSGSQRLLGAASGNMRATDFNWHPIVRQRCLSVETIKSAEPAANLARVLVDEISEGSFDGKTIELRSSRQRFQDGRGRICRLPPLSWRFKPESVLRFTAFGSNKVLHPGGGCHKDLQRGLDITFDCPGAWCRPASNWLQMEPSVA